MLCSKTTHICGKTHFALLYQNERLLFPGNQTASFLNSSVFKYSSFSNQRRNENSKHLCDRFSPKNIQVFPSNYFLRSYSSSSLTPILLLQQNRKCLNSNYSPIFKKADFKMTWSEVRTYAKAKGQKGGKGGKGGKKMSLTSEQLDGLFDVAAFSDEMNSAADILQEKFTKTLTLRTSQGVFDNLPVKTDDGTFPMIQLAQIVQKTPQLIVINMAMTPQYIPAAKEALLNSGLNVNPQQDATSLFIQLPQVTKEHRAKLAKNAKTLTDNSKKTIRNIYSKYSKKIRNVKEGHSKDHIKAADDMAKDIMERTITKLDVMTAAKQKELLGSK